MNERTEAHMNMLSFVLLFCVGATSGYAQAQSATTQTATTQTDFSLDTVVLNQCNDEFVHISGTMHLKLTITPGPKGFIYAEVVNSQDVTGVGYTTGLKYESPSVYLSTFIGPNLFPFHTTQRQDLRLVAPDANFQLLTTINQTILNNPYRLVVDRVTVGDVICD